MIKGDGFSEERRKNFGQDNSIHYITSQRIIKHNPLLKIHSTEQKSILHHYPTNFYHEHIKIENNIQKLKFN